MLTSRDISLIRDIGLSHLLSRDQIISLGYFTSVTRANTRLRELALLDLVKRLDTPFLGQSLYMAGENTHELVGDNVARLLEKRTGSPRFVQHALSVTNVRIALLAQGAKDWRFEQQLWRTIGGNSPIEVRPDGLVYTTKLPMFIEVDLGHVSPAKFSEKLRSYGILISSGMCPTLYGFDAFRLLTITTGSLRARHLRKLQPLASKFEHLVQTFEEIGIPKIGCWS